ncbi:hypothetical protein BU17DRAFT_95835 [Hysterangium stoloniferum]|nr:hypothetical protein BU17DRAFT_95835 [Hysterangium stoloniferum]
MSIAGYQNPPARTATPSGSGWTPQYPQYAQYPQSSQPQYPNNDVGYMQQPGAGTQHANIPSSSHRYAPGYNQWGVPQGQDPQNMPMYAPPPQQASQQPMPGYPGSSNQHQQHSSGSWRQQGQGGYQQAPQAPSLPQVHNYAPLPSMMPQNTIDTYLRIVHTGDADDQGSSSQANARSKRAYQCIYQGCAATPFKSKDNARVHVHKHFGADKLFECVVPTWKQFASEDAAKRHRDTTETKQYFCAVCGSKFARKDYRDQHQTRCNFKP